MNPIADLYRLQEIDTAWEKIRQRILQLQKFVGGSPKLNQVREQTQAAEIELNTIRKEQQDTELEANSLGERVRESEAILMGGQVQNPKELEALQANVESMRRHKETLDDRSVEALVKAESLAAKYASLQESLSTMEAEWTSTQATIEEELQRRKKEYVYLKNIRDEAVKTISAKYLEQYEYLRGRKNGIAVAKLEDDSCGACHMQLPVGVIGSVRRNEEMVSCTACGRILFAAG
ncbi:MAG: hypothetical protein KF753_20805 [Caldilineaceae bacterium]|nr:hypothetical protein [Caldilineaceae bacterium]